MTNYGNISQPPDLKPSTLTVTLSPLSQRIRGINDQDPERILEFAASVCDPEADVLFCSCTAWRSMEAADRLEQTTGKPVVASNQAAVWKTFKTLGLKVRTRGFGQLLDQLA